MRELRTDWTLDEVRDIYNQPLLELAYQASVVHRKFQSTGEVQVCTLLSIKTGGCPEDCAYCPQSARFNTEIDPAGLLPLDDVRDAAQKAAASGSTRFCMGAAWRRVRNNNDFERVLSMVREVNDMGLEVCATLGMLTPEQANRLKEAGLTAYNHNLDTSEEHYGNIITTRTYADRLETISHVQKARISVCSGGDYWFG